MPTCANHDVVLLEKHVLKLTAYRCKRIVVGLLEMLDPAGQCLPRSPQLAVKTDLLCTAETLKRCLISRCNSPGGTDVTPGTASDDLTYEGEHILEACGLTNCLSRCLVCRQSSDLL